MKTTISGPNRKLETLPVYDTNTLSIQEQRRTYKTYAVLNTILFACAFILAGALVGVSGARHSQAVDRCLVSLSSVLFPSFRGFFSK
jgi:hypothetical protein